MVQGITIPPPEEAQGFVSKTLLDTVLVSESRSRPAAGTRFCGVQFTLSVQVKGLAALCKEKPADPVRWLAVWLLTNNPAKPAVLSQDGTVVDVASVRTWHMNRRYKQLAARCSRVALVMQAPAPKILEPSARLRVQADSAELVTPGRCGHVACGSEYMHCGLPGVWSSDWYCVVQKRDRQSRQVPLNRTWPPAPPSLRL
jgi:hypothetical protein